MTAAAKASLALVLAISGLAAGSTTQATPPRPDKLHASLISLVADPKVTRSVKTWAKRMTLAYDRLATRVCALEHCRRAAPRPTAAAVPPPSPTAPRTTPGSAVVLAAVGDISCPSLCAGTTGTGEVAAALRPRWVVTIGDHQYPDDTLRQFDSYYDRQPWGAFARTGIDLPVPGNHEYQTANAAGYSAYYGAAAHGPGFYYERDLGNGWLFVGLNSECSQVSCAVGSPQELFLRAALAAHGKGCVVVAYHHPAWTSGRDAGSAAVLPLWRDLVDAHVALVLNGHNHSYERYAPLGADGRPAAGGAVEIVNGAGGYSHYPIGTHRPGLVASDGSTFGIVELTLSPGAYSGRFVPSGGGFGDAYAGTCA